MIGHRLENLADGRKICTICGRTWKRSPRSDCSGMRAGEQDERDLQTIDQLWKISLVPLESCTGTLEEITQHLRAIQRSVWIKLADIQEQIARLEQAGVTGASTYWRKDSSGNSTILYLIFPSRNGKRKQKYVGKNPTKQALALAQLERWEQRQHLLWQANHLLWQVNRLADRLGRLQCDIRVALETAVDLHRQCEFQEKEQEGADE